jgi:hypothetical protein
VTIPAVHCEARKVSYRQTKEGLVVAFVIHPNDMPDALAVAPLGTRYMLALAAIGDDEQPIEQSSQRQPMSHSTDIKATAERPGVETGSSPTARARASYANLPPMEQARVRACVLPTNGRFQQWVASETGGIATEEHAELYIKARCCGCGSRNQIANTRECYDLFLTMETDFKFWDGQIAERRG